VIVFKPNLQETNWLKLNCHEIRNLDWKPSDFVITFPKLHTLISRTNTLDLSHYPKLEFLRGTAPHLKCLILLRSVFNLHLINFSNFPNLQHLDLSWCVTTTDLLPLKNSSSLITLNLFSNQCSFDGIQYLTNLKALNIYNCSLNYENCCILTNLSLELMNCHKIITNIKAKAITTFYFNSDWINELLEKGFFNNSSAMAQGLGDHTLD
jgi:hypothetical protein